MVMGGRPDRVPIRPFVVAPHIAKLRRARTSWSVTRRLGHAPPGSRLRVSGSRSSFMPQFGARPIEAKATVAVTSPYAWLFNNASGSGVAQLVQKKPRLAI